ncbi:hypothetical protein QSU96_18920 [Vibrio furnissii]|uniref:hypothetical protein n=1 Tax=Vibrio furnissii TaxID=29494 RepID=UPI002573F293|nr:hypothetical protein [Vibrio furnissii]WJG29031.1 hypothetical protein QSU96_18920 [Vibrio furnissii]
MFRVKKLIAFAKDKRVLIVLVLLLVAILLLHEGKSINGDEFYNNFVVGSLFPEMIGVVAELIFVYLIFSYIEQNRRQKEVIENERRARSYLRFFVVDLLRHKPLLDKCCLEEQELDFLRDNPEKFKFYDFQYDLNNRVINKLSEELQTLENEALCNHIRKHVEIELNALQSMLPVVSQISKEHFKTWQRILYFMSLINRGDNTVSNTKKVLAKIRSFDLNTKKQFNVRQRT